MDVGVNGATLSILQETQVSATPASDLPHDTCHLHQSCCDADPDPDESLDGSDRIEHRRAGGDLYMFVHSLICIYHEGAAARTYVSLERAERAPRLFKLQLRWRPTNQTEQNSMSLMVQLADIHSPQPPGHDELRCILERDAYGGSARGCDCDCQQVPCGIVSTR